MSQRSKTAVLPMVVAVLTVVFAAPVFGANVEAEVSSRETQVGVPIVLQITIEDGDRQQPPTLPPIPGVSVRSAGVPSQRSETVFANGVTQSRSTLTYAFELTPFKEGSFTIPTIEVASGTAVHKTEPITVVVTKSETKDLCFVEVSGSRKKLYAGEKLLVTLQIWLRPYQEPGYRVKFNTTEMFRCVDLGHSQWGPFQDVLQQIINAGGRGLSVSERLRKDSAGAERAYYLYSMGTTIQADRPGRLSMDNVTVRVAYPAKTAPVRDFFGGQSLRVLSSASLESQAKVEPIDVLPIPTRGRPAYFSGAVGTYSVEATARPTEVAVGDPITLSLLVSGTGNLQDLQPPPLAQMPELTGHFRLPTDPLAGEVTPAGKKFTVSVRAMSDAVKEIPAIPFAYFDPRQETFITVCTQPIQLTVKPADKLAMSQIVDATGGHAPAANRLTESAGGILANYTGMDEVLTQQGFTPGPAMWAALMLPPVGFAVSWTLRRRSERLRTDIGFARKRRARRDAVHRLRQIDAGSTSQAAAMVSSALGQYVADRCNLPVGGMTRATIVQQVKERATQADTVAGLDALLDECEGIHYAGAGTRSAAELRQMAMSCIDRLEREKW